MTFLLVFDTKIPILVAESGLTTFIIQQIIIRPNRTQESDVIITWVSEGIRTPNLRIHSAKL